MATSNHKAIDLCDGIDARLYRAQAICSLAAAAPDSEQNQIPDDAIPGAMWAVRELLEEVGKLSGELCKLATGVKHGQK